MYKKEVVDVRDATPSSVLVAAGIDGAQGIHDFVLNYVRGGDGLLDDVPCVPHCSLLAPLRSAFCCPFRSLLSALSFPSECSVLGLRNLSICWFSAWLSRV